MQKIKFILFSSKGFIALRYKMRKLVKIALAVIIISILCSFTIAATACKNINGLIQNLSSDNEKIRSNAENALIRIGKPAVEALIEILKDKENPQRVSAAKILSKIGDGSAIKPLVDCLTEPGEYSIKDKIEDTKAEELYIEIFGEKPPEAPEMPTAPEMGEMPEQRLWSRTGFIIGALMTLRFTKLEQIIAATKR